MMKNIFTVALLITSLVSYGQKGMWKPFKLLVIQPDTAIIDKSLSGYRDTIEAQNLKSYFTWISQMEGALTFKSTDSITKKGIQKSLAIAKAQEAKVREFKYFQLVSSYSPQVYNFYFNEYAPLSEIYENPYYPTDIAHLTALADSAEADYLIFYTNIHTFQRDGGLWLKMTTSLYAKQERQLIFSKETEGNTRSLGDMWTCGNELSCLLINGIRTSTDAVTEILRKRQIRK
jgi:hypothetical protein